MNTVTSKNGVSIRLTAERWLHIIENHDDLAGYYDDVLAAVEEPDYITKGYRDALVALKEIEKGRFVAVIYKEVGKEDGFIVTAYFASKVKLQKEEVLWRRK